MFMYCYVCVCVMIDNSNLVVRLSNLERHQISNYFQADIIRANYTHTAIMADNLCPISNNNRTLITSTHMYLELW